MKIAKLVTAKEFDPFIAMALNTRFTGFLVTYAKHKGLKPDDVINDAREILQAADIDQDAPEV